ncbi:MaoC family dehydratase [Pyruvatibacter mobilis]|jgi:acyl dehydratase|uniref:MaoC family dehydratase n=1 Tax=Pyruvatibacter mobilis TaxID=1712261 RepID=A0A845QAD4_9HYPH|nr:MaoC family dehydratase [Pyruvatibacter mobilis]NBG95319.1 MaoC family dehydratase [Pyruvatibacter mobilis]QJD75585.1 MaoC family dehydratase [Pyruvatibacter mobilis]GGD16799.1 MaoC family dehydratase [Pyruvatibacter mobilis]
MRVFENLDEMAKEVGNEIGVSEWVEIDQDRINLFADATGDHQWIHLDAERTQKELGMPTIAHGYLTLSLLPMLSSKVSGVKSVNRGINYGSNKVRFTNMVPVNSKVRARVKLLKMEPKAGGQQVTNEVTMEVEGSDRPAMVAETLSLLFE